MHIYTPTSYYTSIHTIPKTHHQNHKYRAAMNFPGIHPPAHIFHQQQQTHSTSLIRTSYITASQPFRRLRHTHHGIYVTQVCEPYINIPLYRRWVGGHGRCLGQGAAHRFRFNCFQRPGHAAPKPPKYRAN